MSESKGWLSVFLTKCFICYDHKLERPWNDGALAGMSKKGVFLLSIVLSLNTLISYAMFGSNSFSLVCFLVITLIQIWIRILLPKLWRGFRNLLSKKDQLIWDEAKVKFPKSVRTLYQQLFNREVQPSPMGWTQFSASFRTGYEESDYVFKLIDIKEYVRYRFSSLPEEEETEVVHKFNRDYKFLLQINHQNIARIIRADRFSTKRGIVRQLVVVTKMATQSLQDYITLRFPKGVGLYSTRLWFKQVVDAVHYLHCQLNKDQPIAHMNIKPENILLYATNETGEEFTAKLCDCGLDIYFPKSGQITTDDNKYLISAPEYVFNRKMTKFQRICQTKGTDALASDIFSLGVILVLLIKGKVSEFVETPKEMQTSVNAIYVDFSWKNSKDSIRKMFVKKEDRHLIHLLKGMLERKPENRFDIISVKNHPWIDAKQN